MPQADPIVRAQRVELVDDDFSTDKRERVAKYIQENWNDDPQITLSKIAEETDTSRQHVKNVLDDHFEDAGRTTTKMTDNQRQPAIPDRENVDPELLRIVISAYRMGCKDCQSDDVEPGITEELLELATLD